MEELRSIEECLIRQVETQCSDIKKANTMELGQVIDIIKDLEKSIYYHTVVEAMEKGNSHILKNDAKDISYCMYTDNQTDLEHYLNGMSEDLTHMVEKSSMEEKQMLSTKLQQLANKIK